MPITEELDNIRKFESVGFSHEQDEALAESLEKAQVNGNESLKEFIRSEINASELRMKASLTDLQVKIFGIVVGTVGLAVTILKLFP
ncbi:MAG: hypothetical protein GY941_11920 [Planctomycetes bacterium]|nr:hypothetical protein [Planctomycetota bacterium]